MKRFPVGLVACGVVFVAMVVAAVVATVMMIASAAKVRSVEIPTTGDNFVPVDSQVIRSPEELNAYVATLRPLPDPDVSRPGDTDGGWQGRSARRKAFVDGLRNSGVDFEKEVLVVAGFSVPNGDDVSPATRVGWHDGVCVCQFRTTPTGKKRTRDLEHVAVFVVPTRTVERMDVRVNNVTLNDEHPCETIESLP